MIINLNNIDNFLFLNKNIRIKLKDLNHIFLSWDVANRIPNLSNIKQTARLDLLNALKENHLQILREEFKEEDITIENIDYKLSKNYDFSFDDNFELQEKAFINFCVTRNKDKFGITCWR